MKELASWTPRRVVWACVLWLLGAPVIGALGLILGGLTLAALSGKQSIGVSVHLSDFTIGWVLVPPMILVGGWIWSRAQQPRRLEPPG
jgi:ABC-type uncharacterized transport system permease subunit